MTGKVPFRKIDIENTLEAYAAIAAVIVPALRTTLEELVSRDPEGAALWFDELEARLISGAKGTITEGIPIEVEASSLKSAIDVLQATLDVVRSNLIGKDTD